MIDIIDKSAGLLPDEELYRTRRFRPEFVEGAEQCRLSVLRPVNDQGLAEDLRLALARRIAMLNQDASLLAEYDAQLKLLAPSEMLLKLAEGEGELPEPLSTVARHADLITLMPFKAERKHITRLEVAGLSNPQIVALSELIAFVNFETRVVSGLRLMRSV